MAISKHMKDVLYGIVWVCLIHLLCCHNNVALLYRCKSLDKQSRIGGPYMMLWSATKHIYR